MDKELSDVYYNLRNPNSYGSINKLMQATNNRYKRENVARWLAAQDAYTLHKQRIKRFQRCRFFVPTINNLFQADLCDMQSLSRYNRGIKYIMTVIDCFSRKAWAFPLKNKKSESIITAFKRLFKETKPKYVQTDKGKEYLNAPVQSFLRKNQVKFYHTNNPDVKAAVVERFNRTLKSKMYKHFTRSSSNKYINILNALVHSYNNCVHSATKMAPNQVTKENEKQVYDTLYGGLGRYGKYTRKPKRVRFKVGDKVRIDRAKMLFEKGYEANWSQEVFVINEIVMSNPVRYKIKDLKDEVIEGTFYEPELQLVIKSDDDFYKIDKVLDRRGKGASRELLVSWKGYPAKFNSWIKASQLKK